MTRMRKMLVKAENEEEAKEKGIELWKTIIRNFARNTEWSVGKIYKADQPDYFYVEIKVS